MSETMGSGSFKYGIVENRAKLPPGWEFIDVAAVAVDKRDRV
jgi:beta-glucanase (GH16 family)